MLKDFIYLSQAEISQVFKARSHPQIYGFLGDFSGRKNEPKSFKNFINYLKTQNDKKYYALFKNDDLIGVICFFELSKTAAQIGFYKNPTFKKVGSILIENLLDKACQLGLSNLLARVKKDNEKSLVLLRSFGFLELETKEDKIILTKKL